MDILFGSDAINAPGLFRKSPNGDSGIEFDDGDRSLFSVFEGDVALHCGLRQMFSDRRQIVCFKKPSKQNRSRDTPSAAVGSSEMGNAKGAASGKFSGLTDRDQASFSPPQLRRWRGPVHARVAGCVERGG